MLRTNVPQGGKHNDEAEKNGAFLVNFVIDFANGDMSRFF